MSLTLVVTRSLDPQIPIASRFAVPSAGGTLGRQHGADVLLPSSTVSRTHARLTPSGDAWRLEALTAGNGTFIDGEPVPVGSPQPVTLGSSVQIGGIVLTLEAAASTTPVLQPLETPRPLLHARLDGDATVIHCGEHLLNVAPQPARALTVLMEHAGTPVHRWDLLDAVGRNADLDRCISKLRRALRDALAAGRIPRGPLLEGILQVQGAPVDELDDDALVRRLIWSRRGHGYVLCLPAQRVTVERV